MNIITTKIPDIKIIQPQVFEDSRGYFFESYNQASFESVCGSIRFVQDNESKSIYGTLRGIHFQKPPFDQDKLVRVIEGRVWDVAVDLRLDSPTYKQWIGEELSSENKRQLFIPKGFGHAFVVLSETAIFAYKVSAPDSPEHDGGIRFDDPVLNIDWPLPEADLLLSEKDRKLPFLQEVSG